MEEGGAAVAGAPAARPSLGALRAVAFVAGAGTMGIEMAAARMLAPAFGTSQFVWAALIGVVLLALAVGYRLGGRLADRHPGSAGLFGSLLAAGILAAVLPLAGRWADAALARGLTGTPLSLVLLALAAVLLLVAPPVLLLAFATPFALRLGVARGGTERAGTLVGSLEAWATAGSICGTFVPAFLTIPFCGTDQTLLGISALLIATGALGLARPAAWLAALLPAALLPLLSGPVLARPGLIYEAETPYQFVQVVRRNGLTELLVNDGAGVQSAWRNGSDLTGMYFDTYALLPELRPGRTRSVLVVGAGGGTILRQYAGLLAGRYRLRLMGFELDPVVKRLGERYLGLPPALAADIRVGDGRVLLAATRARYDIVIVDAYAAEVYIPFDLATRQFFALVRRHLRPGGLVALNVNALSPHALLLRSIVRTLHTVFPYTYLAKVPGEFNYLVCGALTPVDPRVLTLPGRVPPTLRALGLRVAAGWRADAGTGGWLLTDNRAPVDYLTNREIVHGAERLGFLGSGPAEGG